MHVYSSTQHPTEVQHVVARVLGTLVEERTSALSLAKEAKARAMARENACESKRSKTNPLAVSSARSSSEQSTTVSAKPPTR